MTSSPRLLPADIERVWPILLVIALLGMFASVLPRGKHARADRRRTAGNGSPEAVLAALEGMTAVEVRDVLKFSGFGEVPTPRALAENLRPIQPMTRKAQRRWSARMFVLACRMFGGAADRLLLQAQRARLVPVTLVIVQVPAVTVLTPTGGRRELPARTRVRVCRAPRGPDARIGLDSQAGTLLRV